jgi:hypothetical protein
MPGAHEVEIKIVRESGEVHGTVPDIEGRSWEVLPRPEPGGMPGPVSWEVVVEFPEEIEPLLLFFESRELAQRWAATDPRAQGFDWSGLDPPAEIVEPSVNDESTRRYRALAEEQDLAANSPEVFELAHRAGLLGSTLVVFDQYGTNVCANPYVVKPTALTRLPWTPRSCRSNGSSYLYDDHRQIQAIHGQNRSVPRCAPGAVYARTS